MMASSITPTSAVANVFAKFRNSRPTESDYAAIGKLALQHTSLEYQLEALVWTYIGDTDKSHIATAKMRMNQKIEALETLVEWTEPDDGIADAIEWATKCFNILRDSRNSVIHGFNFTADQSSGSFSLKSANQAWFLIVSCRLKS